MPRIGPFTGLLYDEARVGPIARVSAPPYDTVGPEARRRLLASSPHNIVHLDLAARPGEDDVEAQYTRAAGLLGSWRDERALVATQAPSWFPYEMRFADRGERRRIRGIICEVRLENLGDSIIPHERTMPGPVEDRLQLLRRMRTNLSPVYGLVPGPDSDLASFLTHATAGEPRTVVDDDEGVEHRIWVVDGEGASLRSPQRILIADGHHRYTTALRHRLEMTAAAGPGPWDRIMMLLVDAASERPPVLPIHRLIDAAIPLPAGERVRDLHELLLRMDDEGLTYGIVSPGEGMPEHRVLKAEGPPPTVCAVHRGALASFGEEASGLRFTHDAVEAEAAVRTGDARAALLMPPTSVGRIQEVIDARERMPQKSTYFWPKPRTGLVLRPFDAQPDWRATPPAARVS